jgi:hypothetical protein
MGIVYSYWKCTSCDSINRGDNRECLSCGCPIPAGVKYMMPDDSRVIEARNNGTILEKNTLSKNIDEKGIVSDIVPEKDIQKGPNWNCAFCGYQNRFSDSTCVGCGAGKEESKSDYFGHFPEMTTKNKKDFENRTGTNYDDIYHKEKKESKELNKKGKQNKEIISTFLDIISIPETKYIAISVVCLLWLLFMFIPVTKTSLVTGFKWSRSIDVEEYTLCHEDDWSVPDGAIVTNQKSEIHHYDQVLDHYETKTRQVSEQVLDGYDTHYHDLGNGQAESYETPRYKTVYHTETYQDPVYKDVPVYKTKYYYDIGRWKKVSSLDTYDSNKEPIWATSNLPEDIENPEYGNQRLGNRTEKYYIQITDEKGNSYWIEKDFTTWNSLKYEDKIEYKTFRFSDKPL